MTGHDHDIARLHDYADARLSAHDAQAVADHLSTCEECRRELARIEGAKAVARQLGREKPLPEGLDASLTEVLDAEDRAAIVRSVRGTSWTRRGVLAGVAASVLVAIGVWRRQRPSGSVASVIDAFDRLSDGRLTLEQRSSDPAVIEAYFRDRGPAVRVIDLSAMAYTLEGSLRHRVDGVDSALYTYRGPGGSRLVCQMFTGRVEDLPTADAVRDNAAFRFHVFVRRGVTAVFWQEGSTVCVLASDIPTSEVLALATAKAMLPA